MDHADPFLSVLSATTMHNAQQRALSGLLLTASVHHLRTVVEALPVGQLSFDYRGHLKEIDQFSRSVLGLSEKSLDRELSLSDLLVDDSPDLLQLFREGCNGSCHWIKMRRADSVPIDVRLVITASVEPTLYECVLIFTSEDEMRKLAS